MLSAATMVVLTALLPASPLATYGYALSLSSLVSSFATWRLEQAILVASSERDADSLAWSSLLVAIVLTAIMAALDQAGIFHDASNSYTVGAISAFSMSSVNISQQLLIRKNRSGYAGLIAAFRSLVVSISVIMFAWLGTRMNARAVLLGLLLSSAIVAFGCVVEIARISEARPKFAAMRAAMKDYADVWTSYLGQSVLSGISLNAPYFAIFHFADSRYAAAYLLADRVVRMPVTLLSNSVRSHLTHLFRQLITRHEIDMARAY
jgi:O-antigen/teichoic acid export membrane protein